MFGPSSQRSYIMLGEMAKQANTHVLFTIVTVEQRKQMRDWDGDEWGQAELTVHRPFWAASISILTKRRKKPYEDWKEEYSRWRKQDMPTPWGVKELENLEKQEDQGDQHNEQGKKVIGITETIR